LRKKWGGHQLAGHQQQLTLSQSLSQTQKHTERRWIVSPQILEPKTESICWSHSAIWS
jgi:hypothetical protein